MPTDANLVLQALATKTATFNSSWLDLKTTPSVARRGAYVRVIGSTFSSGTAGTTLTLTIDDSADGSNVGTTAISTNSTIYTSTTTSTPFETWIQIPGLARRYVRLTGTMASGTGPQLAIQAAICPTYP